MDIVKDTGFVLKRTNTGEADRFVRIFTKDHGKIDVLAKGVRKITSKRASTIEPLNYISFQAIKTKKNYVLTEVELLSSFSAFKKDLSSFKLGFLICELIDSLCASWESHSNVFELLRATLSDETILSDGQASISFQKQALVLLGFWDEERSFTTDTDLVRYIEQITERKLHSSALFSKKTD